MTSIDDFEANWRQIESLVGALPRSESMALVSLPENSLYLRLREGEKISGIDPGHEIFHRAGRLAENRNFVLHFGSVPLKEASAQKLYNSSVCVWPDRRVQVTYRKMHLFDIDLEGQKPIRESDVFEHGGQPQMLEVDLGDGHPVWRLGQSICYDVRFSELYHRYALMGADVLMAFLVATGQAHWEVLLRARAIESQAYVVAAAQAGRHVGPSGWRTTFGHSMIVDPWGRVLCQAEDNRPQVLSWQLDREEIDRVRRQIPMAGHRRPC
jgi:deaminated glutathione amidase